MEEVTEAARRLRETWWLGAAAVLGVVSVLRGIHPPNRWSATQALFNYDGRLIRRGLYGATLGSWLHQEHYVRFLECSCVCFVFACVLLALVAGRVRRVGSGQAAAVAAGSFALTFLASLIGYADILLIALTCGLVLIRRPGVRALASLPLCLAGVLLHEMFLVVFLPGVMLSFLMDSGPNSRPWIAFVTLPAVCCLLLTAQLSQGGRMSVVQAAEYKEQLQRRADFPVDDQVVDVLTRSMDENRTLMTGFIYRQPWYRTVLLTNLSMTAPTLALLLYTIVYVVRHAPHLEHRGWIAAAALVAALAPLSMDLIAWDAGRFFALSVVTSLLVLAIVGPRREQARVALPRLYGFAAAAVIGLAMFRSCALIGGEPPNRFPFLEAARHLPARAATGHWD